MALFLRVNQPYRLHRIKVMPDDDYLNADRIGQLVDQHLSGSAKRVQNRPARGVDRLPACGNIRRLHEKSIALCGLLANKKIGIIFIDFTRPHGYNSGICEGKYNNPSKSIKLSILGGRTLCQQPWRYAISMSM